MSVHTMTMVVESQLLRALHSLDQTKYLMVSGKPQRKATFAFRFPGMDDKRKRVWFSILNSIIVVAIVIVLALTLLAIL